MKLSGFSLVILLAAVSANALTLQARQVAITTARISYVSTNASSNACPPNTYTANISPDKSYVTVEFERFQAALASSLPASENEKECELLVRLRYPGGFLESTPELTYQSFAALRAGVIGSSVTDIVLWGGENNPFGNLDSKGSPPVIARAISGVD
jgi:hypothetical protein